MAVQFDVPANGGLTASGAYVRLGPWYVKKNRSDGTYYVSAELEVYKDATEAAKVGDNGAASGERIQSVHVDRFKIKNVDPTSVSIATIYSELKDWLVAQGIVASNADITDV